MLKQESCEACRADAPRVTESEVASLLKEIPEWKIIQNDDGVNQLTRTFQFDDFVSAQAFTNKVADLAESLGHHPKIVLEWGKVEVVWWTHKIKGLHRNDFVAAAKTNDL